LKGEQFTRFTVESGLPSDVICQILDDQAGNFWIGSHHGIFKVAKKDLNAFARGEQSSVPCVSYGLYDGLPTLECSSGYQPAAWRSSDGRLWFATFKGIVSIQPGDVPKNELPPPVVLEEMRVDGKPVATSLPTKETGLKPPGAAQEVQPGRHYLEFHYTALSYVAPDKVRFRYRLHGLENEWVDADTRREAHYSHLRPGTYQFQVIACNNDGVWNDRGTALAFVVLPHFWQTWWFNGSVGAVVLGTLFGTVRFVTTRNLRRKVEQLREQRAIQRDRERIAKDIHDDLGAGLTQIMLQSAMGRKDSPEQMQTHLAQISETALGLVRDMDETVWAINPENDTLDGLVTYVGKFFQEYGTSARLRCRLDLPARLPAVPVAAEVRHNLFLAVKEALHNTIKHAQASEVFLQLKVEPHAFTFILRDDGRGFAPGVISPEPSSNGRISSGHGLNNLAERLKQIGGRCVIHSEPGKGTEIRLTVMIKVTAQSGLN
jgi:signal transduction histidine kinase